MEVLWYVDLLPHALSELKCYQVLIRPCDGGGSIVHVVDHMDLDAWSVSEVLRPFYESSKILAQKMTMVALRHIRQISQETNGEVQRSGGRQLSDLKALSQRLCRGFNDVVNGFADDGWSVMNSDGMDDVTIAVNVSPSGTLFMWEALSHISYSDNIFFNSEFCSWKLPKLGSYYSPMQQQEGLNYQDVEITLFNIWVLRFRIVSSILAWPFSDNTTSTTSCLIMYSPKAYRFNFYSCRHHSCCDGGYGPFMGA